MSHAAALHIAAPHTEHTRSHLKTLPGIGGLRAIAASVVLFHVYSHSAKQLPYAFNYELSSFFIAQNMVNLFFVISGFIITYILLQEQHRSGTISLKNFYIERILRIWPVYFLILLAVYAGCRFTSLFSYGEGRLAGHGLLLAGLFIINFNPFFGICLSAVAHYWPLSVKEQFYLFWPVLFKKSRPWIIALAVFIGYPVMRNIIAHLSAHAGREPFIHALNVAITLPKFSSMALGAAGAMAVKHRFHIVQRLFAPWIQIVCWLALAGFVFSNYYIPYFHYEVLASVYLLLILNVAFNPKPLITLHNSVLNYTGKISYGIYILLLIYLIICFFRRSPYWNGLIAYHLFPFVALTFIITYAIAALSFRYFEQFFLRLKPGSATRNTAPVLQLPVNNTHL